MTTPKIARVGNSTGVTIPRDALVVASLQRGDQVMIMTVQAALFIVAAGRPPARMLTAAMAGMDARPDFCAGFPSRMAPAPIPLPDPLTLRLFHDAQLRRFGGALDVRDAGAARRRGQPRSPRHGLWIGLL